MKNSKLKITLRYQTRHVGTLSAASDLIANDSSKSASMLFHFEYDKEWRANGFALSPHLPLQTTGIQNVESTRIFFDNYLPEGKWLDEICYANRLSKKNTYALAVLIGRDLPGALELVNQGEESQNICELISHDELVERIANREHKSISP